MLLGSQRTADRRILPARQLLPNASQRIGGDGRDVYLVYFKNLSNTAPQLMQSESLIVEFIAQAVAAVVGWISDNERMLRILA